MEALQTQRKRTWAWMPAALILALTGTTAAGISLIPSATAAGTTESQGLVVGASVGDSITLTGCGDAAGTAAAPDLSFVGTFTQGEASDRLTAGCTITINSSSPARLAVLENSADTDNTTKEVMCVDTNTADAAMSCGATSNGPEDFISVTGLGQAIAPGEMGAALTAVANGAAAGSAIPGGWAVGTGAAGSSTFNEIPAAESAPGTTACYITASDSDATCSFIFGAQAGAIQNAGDYRAHLRFLGTTT